MIERGQFGLKCQKHPIRIQGRGEREGEQAPRSLWGWGFLESILLPLLLHQHFLDLLGKYCRW